MTKYTFAKRLSYTVRYGSSSLVSLFASSGSYFGCFVRNQETGELMLPVRVGAGMKLVAENGLETMAAFPARLGTANSEWLNVFAGCGETNLAQMPSNGGMYEAMPYGRAELDGFQLPDSQMAPFMVKSQGAEYDGRNYDRIEVAYRFPSNPELIHGLPSDAVARGSVSISMGPVESNEREKTNLEYLPEAYSFGVIHLVDRAELAPLLAQDGVKGLDPQNDQHWTPFFLDDIGAGSRIFDINLGTVN